MMLVFLNKASHSRN